MSAPVPRTADGALWRAIIIGWAVAAIVLTATATRQLAHLWFPDPDDAMRLLEVRDWLGGQSWWDVGQHRFNGGNFAMHWSRLVDLPIAGIMLLSDPVFGTAVSIRLAMTIVPLATLFATMAIAAFLTRRLAGLDVAYRAVMLAPMSVPLVSQMRPTRIDHHGWQVVLALAAIAALVASPRTRSGVAIGASLAALVTISLEGLPIAAAITGVAALAWAFDPTRRAQLLGLLAAFPAGVVVLHVATRGPGVFAPACDAIAPAWIGAILLGAVVAVLVVLAAPGRLLVRFAGLAIGGAAAAGLLRVTAASCLGGPFARLDPLVYRLWYRNVAEGLPIWDQEPAWAMMTVAFPIVGLFGATMAWRNASGEARHRWLLVIAVAVAALILSLLVMRAGATANAVALPGGAWLLAAMMTRVRRIRPVAVRTVATAGALVAATPGLAATVLLGSPRPGTMPGFAVSPAATEPAACTDGHEVADLAALPRSTLFAPLDIGPDILAWTPHRAIASGYHRNDAAMHRVIAAFVAPPAMAEPLVRATGAAFVVGCPGENETEIYKHEAPDGLWARLERGQTPAWLERVPIPGSKVRAWRVKPAR